MLDYSVADHIGLVRFDRPEKLNALSRELLTELAAIVANPGTDVRVLVLHGAGRSFSVGGDFDDMRGLTDAAGRRTYIAEVLAVFAAIEHAPQTTITAVHGNALGGGCELAIVSDICVADATAQFGLPEGRVGLVPGIAAVRAHRKMGGGWMRYLLLTGESIDASTAFAAGLVTTVTPQGEHVEEAMKLARAAAMIAPQARAAAKELLALGQTARYEDSVDLIPRLMDTADHAEGLAAFAERRNPNFTGR